MSISVQGLRPGVYSELNFSPAGVVVAPSVTIPLIIGEGDDVFNVYKHEMVRFGITEVFKEDITSQVDGSTDIFTIPNVPVTDVDGNVTNNVQKIKVYLNGNEVPVRALDGETGVFRLYTIPAFAASTFLEVSYYYDIRDTLVSEEALDDQADGVAVDFYVHNLFVVDGTNRGLITNDPGKVTVTVGGTEVEVLALNGSTGKITLYTAPALSSQVRVTYYKAFPRMFDTLPESNVEEIKRVGIIPGVGTFVEGRDYAISGNMIIFGPSVSVADGLTAIGTAGFTADLVTAYVYEDIFSRIDATNVDSIAFTGETTRPVLTGTHMGQPSNNPADLVLETHATSPADPTLLTTAYLKGATKEFKYVGTNLGELYCTFSATRIATKAFYLECVVAGGVGVGTYKLYDEDGAEVYFEEEGVHTVADANFGTEGITWPSGGVDLKGTPGYSVRGVYTITFISDSEYSVEFVPNGGTNEVIGSGYINQTFIDSKYGVSWTIMEPTTFTYAAADTLIWNITNNARPVAVQDISIPGVRFTVSDLSLVGVGNTLNIESYNVNTTDITAGTYYYVDYAITKDTYGELYLFTRAQIAAGQHKNVIGEPSYTNKAVLGIEAAFDGGAEFVACQQVERNSVTGFATSFEYADAIAIEEAGFDGGVVPYYHVPMTVDSDVLDAYKNLVLRLSSPRYGREGVLLRGFDSSLDYLTVANQCKNIFENRVIPHYPSDPVITLTDEETGDFSEVVYDASIVCAVIAGMRSSVVYDRATSLVGSGKNLPYIERFQTKMTDPVASYVNSAGCTVLTMEGTSVVVWNESTSKAQTVNTVEPTVTYAADECAVACRAAVKSGVGVKQIVGPTDIIEAISTVLTTKVRAQIILSYDNIKVVQDEDDKRINRCTVNLQSIYTRKWITISFNITS